MAPHLRRTFNVTVLTFALAIALTMFAPLSSAAGIALAPTSGPVGISVQVTGSGFQPQSNGQVAFDNTMEGSFVADGSGNFAITFNVPSSSVGAHNVCAQTLAPPVYTCATFTVTVATTTTTTTTTATATTTTTSTSTTTTSSTTTSSPTTTSSTLTTTTSVMSSSLVTSSSTTTTTPASSSTATSTSVLTSSSTQLSSSSGGATTSGLTVGSGLVIGVALVGVGLGAFYLWRKGVLVGGGGPTASVTEDPCGKLWAAYTEAFEKRAKLTEEIRAQGKWAGPFDAGGELGAAFRQAYADELRARELFLRCKFPPNGVPTAVGVGGGGGGPTEQEVPCAALLSAYEGARAKVRALEEKIAEAQEQQKLAEKMGAPVDKSAMARLDTQLFHARLDAFKMVLEYDECRKRARTGVGR